MRCAHPDPHGQIADREGADTVRAAGCQHIETRHRLGHDPFAFAFGQGAIGFIVQAIHRATGVVVADPALERREAARAGITQAGPQRGDVQRVRRQ